MISSALVVFALLCAHFSGIIGLECSVRTSSELQVAASNMTCDVIAIESNLEVNGEKGYQLSGRNLTIRGNCAESGGSCILDASNKNRHFVVEQVAAETVTFQDLVFVNGTLDNLQTEFSVGGAVYVQGQAVFERCSFFRNKAASSGGAVYLYGGKSLSVTFRNCTFQDNMVLKDPLLNGPAFYNDGGMCYVDSHSDIQEHGFGPITRPCHKIDW